MNCTICQSPLFAKGAFVIAIILILLALKFGIEGVIE